MAAVAKRALVAAKTPKKSTFIYRTPVQYRQKAASSADPDDAPTSCSTENANDAGEIARNKPEAQAKPIVPPSAAPSRPVN
jgi:hypothetical protein